MLMDQTTNPRQMPNRRNIIDAMNWLVKDAKPHDSLFFHCKEIAIVIVLDFNLFFI